MRIALDDFKVKGPTGTHSCLIYEPMREPIWLFRQRLKNERIPMDLLKRYLIILLYALDYLHSECHVLHTGRYHLLVCLRISVLMGNPDLKMENILVTFEQLSVIDDFACAQPANPMPRKIKDGRSIYLSHNDFGPLQSYGILPKIADFDMAVHLEAASHPHVMIPIQHEYYRAPEVILGTGYTYSADIWILGVMVWSHPPLTHTTYPNVINIPALEPDRGPRPISKHPHAQRGIQSLRTPCRDDSPLRSSTKGSHPARKRRRKLVMAKGHREQCRQTMRER